MKILKTPTILMVTFLVALMICGPVAAADVTVDKTVTKTGTDTANVVLTVNGPSSTTTNGADVVFSIDSSGSMSWEDPNDLRKTASKNFVDKMDPTKDQAGVVNWASSVKESQALTNDFSLVKTTIDAGVASGGTDFSVGLGEANKLLDASTIPLNSKNIIFLSDGAASYPTAEVNDAKTKGYKVYTIGLGSGVQPTVLQQMATETGGKYFFAADASALDPIFDEIYQQIKQTVTDVVVTDILPSYISLVGNPTPVPDSTVTNPDGTTTLKWNVGSLSSGQKWTASFNIRSSQSGVLATNAAGSGVSYNGTDGQTHFIPFPTPTVSFGATNVSAAGTIGMQTTAIPIFGLIFAILMVLGGALVVKRE